jgi:hypothetical protein
MNDKELVRVACLIQEALRNLRKGRYLECMRQLNLFACRLQDVTRESRQLGLAVSHDWLPIVVLFIPTYALLPLFSGTVNLKYFFCVIISK